MLQLSSNSWENRQIRHQVVGNCKTHDFSQNDGVVFNCCGFDACIEEFVDELTDLCVGDGVNLLLIELIQDVLRVSVVVGLVGGGIGVLLGRFEEQLSNDCKLFSVVT